MNYNQKMYLSTLTRAYLAKKFHVYYDVDTIYNLIDREKDCKEINFIQFALFCRDKLQLKQAA